MRTTSELWVITQNLMSLHCTGLVYLIPIMVSILMAYLKPMKQILLSIGISWSRQEEFSDLCQLDDIYTKRLVSDLNLSSMNVGELKEHILEECVGALLIYNESDKDKLIKAFSLCKSLDSLTEDVLGHAQFPEQEKQKLLSFVNCCQAVRDAMLLPDYQIRQTLLGSTVSRDSLDTALSFYGLNEESASMRLNPSDEFKDYKEAIILCSVNFHKHVTKISNGVVAKALNNCLSQVLHVVMSLKVESCLIFCCRACTRIDH